MGNIASKTQQASCTGAIEIVPPRSPRERHHFLHARQPRGLVNFGSTCYFNATLTALFASECFKRYISSQQWPMHDELAAALRNLCNEMAKRKSNAVSPRDSFSSLTRLRPDWTTHHQQDAHELLNFLLNHLHDITTATKSTGNRPSGKGDSSEESSGRSAVKLFEGYVSHVTRCLACDMCSTTAEKYFDLCLDMAPTLENALMQLYRMEYMKMTEKYFCEECQQHQNAVRFCRLEQVPQFTVIQLKRFRYDPKTGLLSKIKDVCTFPISLILPPYFDAYSSRQAEMRFPETMSRLQRHWRVQQAMTKKNYSAGTVACWSDQYQHVSMDMLKQFSGSIKQETGQRLKLIAVICHLGSCLSGGHYVAIVRGVDSSAYDNWWLVDDEEVLPLAPEQMRRFCEGKSLNEKRLLDTVKTENAYLLFYESRSH